jgi:glycosyltransferase involved in cell wall biosynthesis
MDEVSSASGMIAAPWELPQRFAFVTAIPQSVHGGSGCYVGISALAAGFRALGSAVETITPSVRVGSPLVDRYLFNQSLRLRREWNYDAVIGFDLDGFALPHRGQVPHVANVKGVLADAVPFERGFTRASMALQARWEARHARHADLVITISQYCKRRLRELYGVQGRIAVVPELIDLDEWQRLFDANPADPPADEFTVLCVCRFYPRKRVALLLRAANLLRRRIPELRVRVVGGGPEKASLLRLWRNLKLEPVVTWVGEITRNELAREYNESAFSDFMITGFLRQRPGTPTVGERIRVARQTCPAITHSPGLATPASQRLCVSLSVILPPRGR